MPLAGYRVQIQDDQGNALGGAQVEVRVQETNQLAALYSDRDGAVPLSNPFSADSAGLAEFHVVGGAYKITAQTGSFTREWSWVGIGMASEYDPDTWPYPDFVQGSNVSTIVVLTQAEYDSIPTKDPQTLYFIPES